MTADDPPEPDLAAVLAAIVPAPRQPLDEDCTCETCRTSRAADTARDDWRNVHDGQLTAQQIRRTEQR